MNGKSADVDLGRAEGRAAPRRRSGRRRARARARRPARGRWRRRSTACRARRSARKTSRKQLGAEVLVRRAATSAAKPPRLPPAREDLLVRARRARRTRTASSSRARSSAVEQLVQHLVGERVARLGVVERDRGDAVGDVVGQFSKAWLGTFTVGPRATDRASGKWKSYSITFARASPDGSANRQRTRGVHADMASTAVTSSSPTSTPARKHFIFTDEHEDLRESMRVVGQKELAPARATSGRRLLARLGPAARMGELGYLGLCFPEEYGGQGGDYYYSLVRAECIELRRLRRPRHGLRGPHRHGPAADRRCSAPRSRSSATSSPAIKGEKIALPRDHRAGRRLRRRRHPDHARSATATST